MEMKTLLLLLAIGTHPALAANHYVRAGGSGNGSDWSNACGEFTGACSAGSLVRGDIYFVGTGTYAGRTWNTPASGTSLITIKHATVSDHGTSTGWNDGYAGQAVWTNRNTFTTGYWTFDGATGDYLTSGIGSYGFQFSYPIGSAGAQFQASYITLRYIDCSGYTGTGNYNYPDQAKCIEAYGGDNWTVSHVAMHGCESCLQGGGDGFLLEYCFIYNSRSISSNFHNNIFYMSGGSNGVIRYNIVWDYNAEGFFLTGYNGPDHDIKIYGNVMYGTGTESDYPRGVEIRQDYSYSNIQVYNNTFSMVDGVANRAPETGNTCTGCVFRNNIVYQYSFTAADATADNNTVDSVNRFVDLAKKDFHLAAPLAGAALAAEFNTDMAGNLRGGDGVWDRGAYEFVTGRPQTIQPPTAVTVTVR